MKKIKELFKANKKFTISVLVAIALCLTIVSISFITDKSYAASGIYGTCSWEIDANGKLTLAPQSGDTTCTLGTGSYPWSSSKSSITSVEVLSKVIATGSVSGFFSGFSNATSMNLANLDTSNVTYMDSMFKDCSALTSLDLSTWNTSNVTGMSSMFEGCSSLISLDVSNFDTSQVYEGDGGMASMFWECSSLTSLDLSSFDTSNVLGMNSMFSGCSSLTSLNLSSFDTSNVGDILGMFSGCSSLTSLDVSNFDISEISSMEEVFKDCSSLTSLDLSAWDMDHVYQMGYTFAGCSSLVTLKLPSFSDSRYRITYNTFADCSSLVNLDLSNFLGTSDSTEGMFKNCRSLKEIDLSGFEIYNSGVNDMFLNVGSNNDEGCKLILNQSYGDYSVNSFKFPWSYYAKEVNGQLQGFYTLSEMLEETGGSNTPTTWVPAYSVTYNGNGGTINSNNTLVKPYRIGSKIATRGITPVKSNSHFNKFTDTLDGTNPTIEIRRNAESTSAYGAKYAYLSSPFSNGNLTLYAQYTADTDTTMTVNRKITGVSSSVTNTFGYTITADPNNPSGATSIPNTFNIAFSGDTPSGGYVQKGTNIDFNNATYSQPGNYKFTITETSSTDSATYPLSSDSWEVSVIIRNVMDYNDEPTGEYERSVIMKKVGESNKENSMLFENTAALTNIKITNTVRGNMADADEYFKIRVNVGGSGTYTLSGLDSSASYGGQAVTNPSTITAGTNTDIYMKHGQIAYIGKNGNISEISGGVTYRIIEQDALDYTTSINNVSGKDSGNKTTNLTSNEINILNENGSQVPTGVILKILPYVIVVLVVISGIILFIIAKKKHNKEERIV